MIPFQRPVNRQTQMYTSGRKLIFDKIPYSGKITRMWVRFFGSVTITHNTTTGTPIGDLLANLAQNIRVLRLPDAGLGQYRVDCSGQGLVRLAQQIDKFLMIDRNGVGNGTFTYGAGAAGTYAIDVWIPIIFGRATALDVYQPAQGGTCTSFKVEVSCASIGQLFSGTDSTWNADNTIQVQILDTREDSSTPEVPLYIEDHYAQILAAKTDYRDDRLPTTGTFVNILAMTRTQGVLQTLADGVINWVTFTGPSIDMTEADAMTIKANNRPLESTQSLAGIHNFDFHGKFGHVGVDAGSLTQKWNVLNPSGSGNDFLHIVTKRTPLSEAQLSAMRNGRS